MIETTAANPKPVLRGVSHQLAFLLALAAAGELLAAAGTSRARWAGLVYALSLVTLFGISGAYHGFSWNTSARLRLRRLDHGAIYLLIAGSYTPLCVLGGNFILLAVVWSGAAVGFLLAAFGERSYRKLNSAIYVLLGCSALFALPSLSATLGHAHTVTLLAGGAVYIAGAAVYARRWPNPWPRVFGYHEIFHVMVITAAALHYSVMLDLVRRAR